MGSVIVGHSTRIARGSSWLSGRRPARRCASVCRPCLSDSATGPADRTVAGAPSGEAEERALAVITPISRSLDRFGESARYLSAKAPWREGAPA
jgi:hypothetical protein